MKGLAILRCTWRNFCLIVRPRAREGWRETDAPPDEATVVDSDEKGLENNDDVGISGSRRKPDTHIRAKASRLQYVRFDFLLVNLTHVKNTNNTNNA